MASLEHCSYCSRRVLKKHMVKTERWEAATYTSEPVKRITYYCSHDCEIRALIDFHIEYGMNMDETISHLRKFHHVTDKDLKGIW